MKELQLAEIKQIETEILKKFDAFCSENGIRYFLSNGTLLGSVKYKGFIPWDDDIDVLMPREDYERLINSYVSEGDMKLLCREHDNNYLFPFAKLTDTTTVIKGQTALKNYECGVHMDIFPIDGWSDDVDQAERDADLLHKYVAQCGLSISKFGKGRTFLRTVIKNLLILFTRIKTYRRCFEQLYKKTAESIHSQTNNCGCVVWAVYGKHEVIPSHVFSDVIHVEFEGGRFPAPVGYDLYLRSLYGDYEKDPPVEKQKTHHSFKAYKL